MYFKQTEKIMKKLLEETFTSLVLAVHYGLLFNLYPELVPCFVNDRGGSKKLVWTFRFHSPTRVRSTHQIRLLDKEPHSHIYTVNL